MPNLSDYNPAVKYGANLDVNVDLADIRDANNNELLELDTVASAVNYVRIANSATGSAPELSAQGDDTNVNLQLTRKGTAIVFVGDSNTSSPSAGAGGILAATLNTQRGRITVPRVDILQGSVVVIDLTNSAIAPNRFVIASIGDNAATTGTPYIRRVTSGAGSATIVVSNSGAAVVNGALDVQFIVV